MENSVRFINGDEATRHFMLLSKHDMAAFTHRSLIKVWPQQNLIVYRYEVNRLNPRVLAKLQVMELGVDEGGAYGTLLNAATQEVFELGHAPILLNGYDVGVGFPHRPYFERTIRQKRTDDRYTYGISTALQIYHRCAPDWQNLNQDFIGSWNIVRDNFTDPAAFQKELNTLNRD